MTESPAASAATEAVRRLTRWADDFPVPGVRFADLTPVFADAAGFAAVVHALDEIGPEADLVAGIDARGFLLAGGVALARGCGLLAVRKGGKLPPPVLSREYDLEYGTARLEVPTDGLDLHGRRVLIIDDVLATGGTLAAAAELVEAAGATVVAIAVVLELSFLGGRDKVTGASGMGPLTSLLQL